MAVTAKKVKRVVDEMAKFDKGEIEFLFELIKESMIPGKYLPTAMNVVTAYWLSSCSQEDPPYLLLFS